EERVGEVEWLLEDDRELRRRLCERGNGAADVAMIRRRFRELRNAERECLSELILRAEHLDREKGTVTDRGDDARAAHVSARDEELTVRRVPVAAHGQDRAS